MKAVIRDYRKDPVNPVILLTVISHPDGTVHMEGSEPLASMLRTEGIRVNGVHLPPRGDDFVAGLPYYFTSAYLRAEIIE